MSCVKAARALPGIAIPLADLAREPLFFQGRQFPAESPFAAAGQGHVPAMDTAAEEFHPRDAAIDIGLRLDSSANSSCRKRESRASPLAVRRPFRPTTPCRPCNARSLGSKPFLDESVAPSKVEIGQVLRGETADGQSPSHRTAKRTNDALEERQQGAVLEIRAAAPALLVRHAVKVLADVEFEKTGKPPCEALRPRKGRDPPSSRSTGIGSAISQRSKTSSQTFITAWCKTRSGKHGAVMIRSFGSWITN